MSFAERRTFWLVFVVVTTVAVSCAKKTDIAPASSMGGQITGGGSVAPSTTEQVNAALDQALVLISEPGPQNNIVVQFWLERGAKSSTQSIARPVHVFTNYQFAGNDKSKQFDNQFAGALKLNKIVRRPEGDCPHPDYEKTADASVSELNYNAELCFSIGNLTRIPPSALLREVVALVLHEAAHMGGADEPEAQAWQKEFSDYFGWRIGDLSDNITIPTFQALSEAHLLIAQAQQHYDQNKTDYRIAGDFSQMAGLLQSLPKYNDPIALKLKLNSPHPELISKYTAAVDAIVGNVKMHFESYTSDRPMGFISSINIPKQTPSKDDILADIYLKAIKDYEEGIDRVYDAFLAFTEANYQPKLLAEPKPN